MNVPVKVLITIGLMGFLIVQAFKLWPEYDHARVKALDAVHPNVFDELVIAAEKKKPLPHPRMWAYQRYFAEVARRSPQRADALGMQGFCSYQLGKDDQAIEFYKKAASLVPGFYGFHYNLAVVYFKTGRYEDAAKALSQALQSDPKESLLYILSGSKVYALILLAKMNALGKPMPEQLSEGYQKAYALMVLTQYRLQTGQLPSAEIPPLEIF